MSDFPSQQQDKFVLRLPDGMREKIKERAALENRSMNAEIINALNFYFGYDPDAGTLALPDGMSPPSHPMIQELQMLIDDMHKKLDEK